MQENTFFKHKEFLSVNHSREHETGPSGNTPGPKTTYKFQLAAWQKPATAGHRTGTALHQLGSLAEQLRFRGRLPRELLLGVNRATSARRRRRPANLTKSGTSVMELLPLSW